MMPNTTHDVTVRNAYGMVGPSGATFHLTVELSADAVLSLRDASSDGNAFALIERAILGAVQARINAARTRREEHTAYRADVAEQNQFEDDRTWPHRGSTA